MASVKDLTPFGINIESCRKISEQDFKELVRQNCQPKLDDVLIAKDGATALDTVCEFKQNLDVVLLSSVAILRPDTKKIIPGFLRYYLDCNTTREYLKNGFITGAAIPRVVLEDFKRAKIKLPPLPTQRKIAAILSAYDDLIENNTRRIKILEEMAQALYREWFVHFRFPGHDKVQMVDSPLGRIPEGWEVKKVSDAIIINPKTKVPKQGMKPFITMDNLSTNSMIIESYNYKDSNSGSKFKNGDTLFARITPCLENGKTGFVQLLPDDVLAIGSTEFIVLRSKTLIPELVYLIARSEAFREHAIKSMSGATGRQRVRENCFDNFLIVQPEENILRQFHDIVSLIFENVHILSCKNISLRSIRDLLLPKLVSCEIDVSELKLEEGAD